MSRNPRRRFGHLTLLFLLVSLLPSPFLRPQLEAAQSASEEQLIQAAGSLLAFESGALEAGSEWAEDLGSEGSISPVGAEPPMLLQEPGSVAPTGNPEAGSSQLATFSYTVQPGESLAEIADRFGIDVPTLLGSNDLDDPDLLPAGIELTILPVRGVLYRVAEGDTLNRIARRYSLPVPEILKANAIEDSELIAQGQELILPGAKPLIVRTRSRPDSSATAAQPPTSELASTLEKGESPSAASSPSVAVEASQPVGRTTFIWPASGPITTYFGQIGWTSPRGHAGLDIAASWGAPIAAAAPGQVLLATRAGGAYGIEIIIDHGSGLRTVYGHLSQLNVTGGERVSRGQLIGLVGSTGFSTGPHLHFEVRQNGELRNPLGYLP